MTGYIRGGVTALTAREDFPVFADWAIEMFDTIAISAGRRGLQILLALSSYINASKMVGLWV